MGIRTTEKDFDEAKYVMSLNACTTLDLEQWRIFECDYDKEEGTEEEKNVPQFWKKLLCPMGRNN